MAGIWKYEKIAELVKPEFRLSLNEGNTPIDKIDLFGCEVYLKREDQNPNQSFKDRSMAFMLSHYYQTGKNKFVISSSGNAAWSAAAYCKLIPNAELTIFVSDNIPDYKYKSLEKSVASPLDKGDLGDFIKNSSTKPPLPPLSGGQESGKFSIVKSKRSKSDAFKFARENDAVNLRASTDDNALPGYWSLGYEIAENVSDADAVFVCCSSGTGVLGIGKTPLIRGADTAVHIVQTTKIYPIAGEFDKNFITEKTSVANAISDRVAHRKSEIIDIVKKTKGSGWVVSNYQLKEAKELAKKYFDLPGYNAYVTIAGLKKAIDSGYKFKKVVCVVSGI